MSNDAFYVTRPPCFWLYFLTDEDIGAQSPDMSTYHISKAYFKEFTLGGHYMQKALMNAMGHERCDR